MAGRVTQLQELKLAPYIYSPHFSSRCVSLHFTTTRLSSEVMKLKTSTATSASSATLLSHHKRLSPGLCCPQQSEL